MSDSIFKQMGSVISNTLTTKITEMQNQLNVSISNMTSLLNTEVLNMNNYVKRVSYTWIIKNENYTIANAFEAVACDTTNGAFTITLPLNPLLGDSIRILDASSNFNIHNITIDRNGQKIMGLDENMTLSTNNITCDFIFINNIFGWRLI